MHHGEGHVNDDDIAKIDIDYDEEYSLVFYIKFSRLLKFSELCYIRPLWHP